MTAVGNLPHPLRHVLALLTGWECRVCKRALLGNSVDT